MYQGHLWVSEKTDLHQHLTCTLYQIILETPIKGLKTSWSNVNDLPIQNVNDLPIQNVNDLPIQNVNDLPIQK